MAISRGAGTEIIRSHMFEYTASNTTVQDLIVGVADHIYTVLSIVCFAKVASDGLEIYLLGYDALAGDTGQNVILFQAGSVAINQTYVINDKFSFNGNEPTNFTGPLDDAAKQNAIADQDQATVQRLRMVKSVNNDEWEVLITFIDQNNA
tara:strand:- start:22 stop:471 length:450 start_codon:yes stop_codon:yes gene_type:complete